MNLDCTISIKQGKAQRILKGLSWPDLPNLIPIHFIFSQIVEGDEMSSSINEFIFIYKCAWLATVSQQKRGKEECNRYIISVKR